MSVKVKYSINGIEFCRTMEQLELSALLQDPEVILISVNEPVIQTYRKKKRG